MSEYYYVIGKCRRCNLPLVGGKLYRVFHSSIPNSRYPISVNAGDATCRRWSANCTDFSTHRWQIMFRHEASQHVLLIRISSKNVVSRWCSSQFVACGINLPWAIIRKMKSYYDNRPIGWGLRRVPCFTWNYGCLWARGILNLSRLGWLFVRVAWACWARYVCWACCHFWNCLELLTWDWTIN